MVVTIMIPFSSIYKPHLKVRLKVLKSSGKGSNSKCVLELELYGIAKAGIDNCALL